MHYKSTVENEENKYSTNRIKTLKNKKKKKNVTWVMILKNDKEVNNIRLKNFIFCFVKRTKLKYFVNSTGSEYTGTRLKSYDN